jgi:hypothetical protein
VSDSGAEALERDVSDDEWHIAETQVPIAKADAADASVVAQEDLETWAGQVATQTQTTMPAGQSRADRSRAA